MPRSIRPAPSREGGHRGGARLGWVWLAPASEQLDCAQTYDAIRKIERQAEAIQALFKGVDEVKHECEIVIVDAKARIGEELRAVPKATQSGRLKIAQRRNSKPGKKATGVQAAAPAKWWKIERKRKGRRRSKRA